jgi:two-component sensor histidine kinase
MEALRECHGRAEAVGRPDLAVVIMGELELRLSARSAHADYQGELAQGELSEDHINGLNRELAHRAKNRLAFVQAIVRQTSSKPALSSRRGQMQAQEMRWPSEGKRLMSMSISARIARALRSLTPGIEITCSTAVRKG